LAPAVRDFQLKHELAAGKSKKQDDRDDNSRNQDRE
jgi:hypothetical protein